MTRVLMVVCGLAIVVWVWVEWRAERAAHALEVAIRQAEAMSAHPASRPVGPEDRADWPPA